MASEKLWLRKDLTNCLKQCKVYSDFAITPAFMLSIRMYVYNIGCMSYHVCLAKDCSTNNTARHLTRSSANEWRERDMTLSVKFRAMCSNKLLEATTMTTQSCSYG